MTTNPEHVAAVAHRLFPRLKETTMPNPQKAKGSAAERDVVAFLRANGFPHAERRLAGSALDRGDIAGVPAVVIEVKNCTRTDLGAWVDEAVLEQANDRADYGVVLHKRRGKGNVADWYATLPAAQLVRLLRQAGYGQPPAANMPPPAPPFADEPQLPGPVVTVPALDLAEEGNR